MRISDWSSDVCSSDLSEDAASEAQALQIWTPSLPPRPKDILEAARFRLTADEDQFVIDRLVAQQPRSLLAFLARPGGGTADRSDERSVGKEGGSSGRSWWSPYT